MEQSIKIVRIWLAKARGWLRGMRPGLSPSISEIEEIVRYERRDRVAYTLIVAPESTSMWTMAGFLDALALSPKGSVIMYHQNTEEGLGWR